MSNYFCIWLVTFQHERTGAKDIAGEIARLGLALYQLDRRRGIIGFDRFTVVDVHVRQVARQDRIWRVEHEIDGMVVDLADLFDRTHDTPKRRLFSRAAGEREQNIIGIEAVAIRERDILAQMEAPDGRLDDLPSFGQCGLKFKPLIEPDQRFHDVADEITGERVTPVLGIERKNIRLEAPAKRLGLGG